VNRVEATMKPVTAESPTPEPPSVVREVDRDPALAALSAEERRELEAFERHLEALSPERLAAVERLSKAREPYGDDFDRELADLEAGRHPLQQPAT
jgi:hypothetical protein